MIVNERTAIDTLWSKLHFSAEQKNLFVAFLVVEENFTEQVLEEHEQYNKQLTEQWNVQEPIMEKIEKREKILTFADKLKEPMPKKGGTFQLLVFVMFVLCIQSFFFTFFFFPMAFLLFYFLFSMCLTHTRLCCVERNH